jgi:hypothetical protein
VAQIGNVPLRAEDEVKFKGRRRARAHEGKRKEAQRGRDSFLLSQLGLAEEIVVVVVVVVWARSLLVIAWSVRWT